MTQAPVGGISKDHIIDPNQVTEKYLGSLLIGGNFIPFGNNRYTDDTMNLDTIKEATNEHWYELAETLWQPIDVAGKYKVYPLLGTDAVHGNQHVLDTILFPHNIGLAATHDPECFMATGYFMAKGCSRVDSILDLRLLLRSLTTSNGDAIMKPWVQTLQKFKTTLPPSTKELGFTTQRPTNMMECSPPPSTSWATALPTGAQIKATIQSTTSKHLSIEISKDTSVP